MPAEQSAFVPAAAKLLGVTNATIYKYLDGTRYPTLASLRRIERHFGWPVTDQIQLIPDNGKSDPGYGIVLTEVMREHFGKAGAGSEDIPRPVPRGPRGPYRSATGWTHGSVARLLGVRENNVTRWLNGDRYPEARTMLRIEQSLGWPAAEQIALLQIEGYDDRYGTALRAVLDRAYEANKGV